MNTSKRASARRWGPAAIGLTAAAGLVLSGCAAAGGGGSGDADEIVIGFALSQSGNMAPFDVEPGNAALLRVEEINENGGIDGTEIRTVVKDVQSSTETMGVVTSELIAEGADLIVTPCDFDLSAPGAIAAQGAGIPAISICAGDPKTADRTTLGDHVFTANAGSDVEGATGASWAFDQDWTSAYLLQDESIEYTKSTGVYFQAAFEELGGEVVGTSSFPGGDSVDIGAQISDIRANAADLDFIYVASWNPAGATAVKQIRDSGIDLPIVTPAAVDGQLLIDIAGNVSDVYYTAFTCYVYCSGADSEGPQEFVDAYQAKYDAEPSSGYALHGYNLMLMLEQALAETASFEPEPIYETIQAGIAVETPIGELQYFNETCNKIIDFPFSILELSGGEVEFVTQHTAALIPDTGDGNACATQ
ncbi:ABC transporter substrate-binding protein [Gulosibacter sp. 10]|uniref:ABC transporter substrate-binding protein n=1 Tax=Gulosibacter sp. 10 TaxID=1255570 RepID=UPI00097E90D8|nr:ABC transporter substrate-binding protein [Gulosibacter sp. 10]SJM60311.1 Branched-chain amino acid ABC transporter, amino acid-binding protein (TC 3.A.1.4.1) [Gulosibacter sp. 10]